MIKTDCVKVKVERNIAKASAGITIRNKIAWMITWEETGWIIFHHMKRREMQDAIESTIND